MAFKAHQLGLLVRARSRATDPESTDFNWTESDNRPPSNEQPPMAAAVATKFSPDAVCAAGHAGDIQRMGGETAYADQSEDTC